MRFGALENNKRRLGTRFESGSGHLPLNFKEHLPAANAPAFAPAATRVATFISVFVFAATAFAQADPEFARANDEYARGEFQGAIRDYQSVVQAGQWSAPVFYNLGNAYFRTGDFGRAILNYERALALEPQHPESRANLAVAREEARALELQRSRFDALLSRLSPNQLTIMAAAMFWLAVFAVAAIIVARQRSTLAIVIAALGCLAFFIFLAAVYQVENSRKTVAIVTAPEVQARLATADNAKSVLQLPPGSEIRILSRRGEWVYAQLPNNLRGWLPNSTTESVRL
jgi:tetratricopeptide (TPR) repeat protein